MRNLIVMVLCGLFSLQANAWVYSERVTIQEVTQWQDDSPIYVPKKGSE